MGSSDSWDAFDAKMCRTKGTVKKDVHNQFLELSSTQNKSLNLADEDFSALSFQDAKNLIDRDENERLQFMNSNVSFSNGIDQMEAPSLLSVTNYFQQGSSFPVPYIGNDSTMFGESRSGFLPTSLDDTGQSLRRSSSNNHSISRRRKSSRSGTKEDKVLQQVTNQGTSSRSIDLSRNDSLAKFFLGPQSDGLGKMDIMDYVLDYCKRRASTRLSDASDIAVSLSSSSNNTTPERHDSGIGIGGNEKTVKRNDLSSRSEIKDKKGKEFEKENTSSNSGNRRHEKVTLTKCTTEKEDSFMMGCGAITATEILDVSDVGGIDGFEKFKKNLDPRRSKHKDDRFRGKVKHHEEFEKKRLNIDEKNSHPKLSPLAFSGPGSTATMERPSKKLLCSRETSGAVKHSTPREDTTVVHHVTHSPKKQQPCSKSGDSTQELKQSNIAPEGLSVVPVTHSAMQQQQQLQHFLGTQQTCTCPHQCGQQQLSHGLLPNGGLPIVIHIHLPCASTTGTVTHPVPTSAGDNSKM